MVLWIAIVGTRGSSRNHATGTVADLGQQLFDRLVVPPLLKDYLPQLAVDESYAEKDEKSDPYHEQPPADGLSEKPNKCT
jgi:hypothetical protein